MTTVKCLVWDLDETLWRGTLLEGDDVVVPDEVRDVIATLDARGILQSVCSRNDHDDAWARLAKLGLAEYFVVPEIGWGRKPDAVRRIAERLGFDPAAVAFVDDQAGERAEIAFHLPAVRCYPAQAIATLPGLPEFNPRTVSADARRRRQMYQAGERRADERSRFSGPDEDFLRSLDLELRITPATESDLVRVEELTLRTSQMNATGVHYPGETLRRLLADPRHEVLVMSLTDRLGPHGAVGVMLLERYAHSWHLKLMATSCRVVAYGIGAIALTWLTDRAARADVHLLADFRPTHRNRIMEIAYRFAGFDEQHCACTDATGDPGVQLLHLAAERRQLPDVVRVVTPWPGENPPAP